MDPYIVRELWCETSFWRLLLSRIRLFLRVLPPFSMSTYLKTIYIKVVGLIYDQTTIRYMSIQKKSIYKTWARSKFYISISVLHSFAKTCSLAIRHWVTTRRNRPKITGNKSTKTLEYLHTTSAMKTYILNYSTSHLRVFKRLWW